MGDGTTVTFCAANLRSGEINVNVLDLLFSGAVHFSLTCLFLQVGLFMEEA
jgi:hypothetical protein